MKKVIFIMLLFFTYMANAQQKCYCKLVNNYTDLAKKVRPELGEYKAQVPIGTELWLKMNPAASWNKKENGGCRLKEGEFYVADIHGNPIRAWDCGNTIVSYMFYNITTIIPKITYTPSSKIKQPCNCPDDTSIRIDSDLGRYQQNIIPWSDPVSVKQQPRLTGNLQSDILRVPVQPSYYTPDVICNYAQNTYLELYQQYIQSGGKLKVFNVLSGAEKRRVKNCVSGKTWFGRNWGWFVPTVVGVATGGYFALKGGGDSSNGNYVTPADDYNPGNTPGG